MYAAYEPLSDKMQRMLSDLVAIHNTATTFSRTGYRTDHLGGTPQPKVLSAEHPVVRTHPESGRKGLFVNSTFTASIKGMKPRESLALLGFLYRHIETPDFSCRFRWRPNSVAMWDNRCTQHRVVADNRTANRRMERVTINGDKPSRLLVQSPNFTSPVISRERRPTAARSAGEGSAIPPQNRTYSSPNNAAARHAPISIDIPPGPAKKYSHPIALSNTSATRIVTINGTACRGAVLLRLLSCQMSTAISAKTTVMDNS